MILLKKESTEHLFRILPDSTAVTMENFRTKFHFNVVSAGLMYI